MQKRYIKETNLSEIKYGYSTIIFIKAALCAYDYSDFEESFLEYNNICSHLGALPINKEEFLKEAERLQIKWFESILKS